VTARVPKGGVPAGYPGTGRSMRRLRVLAVADLDVERDNECRSAKQGCRHVRPPDDEVFGKGRTCQRSRYKGPSLRQRVMVDDRCDRKARSFYKEWHKWSRLEGLDRPADRLHLAAERLRLAVERLACLATAGSPTSASTSWTLFSGEPESPPSQQTRTPRSSSCQARDQPICPPRKRETPALFRHAVYPGNPKRHKSQAKSTNQVSPAAVLMNVNHDAPACVVTGGQRQTFREPPDLIVAHRCRTSTTDCREASWMS